MVRRKRSVGASAARQLNREQMSRLGADLRASRHRRRLSQATVAGRAALSAASVSDIERGWGGSYSLDTIQLVARIVGRTAIVRLSSDTLAEPADAGHLAVQELVLRLTRGAGFARTFELPTRPAAPARSGDVGLRDDRRRLLILVECWNTIGDVGAAARASDVKRAQAEQLIVATAPLDEHDAAVPYGVRLCWVVRATARNRALVARYPEVFASRFPGSSRAWLRALTESEDPPSESGLVWSNVRATRLFEWRRRA